MKKRKVIVPFEPFSKTVPIIKFCVKDKVFYGIIDSGSEISVFNKESFSDMSLLSTTVNSMSMVGINGSNKTEAIKLVNTDVKIVSIQEDLYLPCIAFISDLSNITEHFRRIFDSKISVDAILGSNFLTLHKAKIDYNKQEIQFVS